VTGYILVVNAGSSSLKVALLGAGRQPVATFALADWDGSADHAELTRFLAGPGRQATAVAHRVVHGGNRFSGPVVIDDGVLAALRELTTLAPLHQPRALAGIAATSAALPGRPAVACFDTAFHASLPPAARLYALPGSWTRQFGLRRFGFHGLSHAYAAGRAAELAGGLPPGSRMVSCHLGAGASLAAITDGRSVDTTMGFTPLEGLVMATRSGSVDPGLLTWLLTDGRLTVAEVAAGLEHSAGLAGLSGLPSGDVLDVQRAAAAGDQAARLALEVYVHRLRREIAAMTAALGGLDVLLFTGGIGEHNDAVRSAAAAGLGYLGVRLDPARNRASADAEISHPEAAVRSFVITAREDLEMAAQTRALLAGG